MFLEGAVEGRLQLVADVGAGLGDADAGEFQPAGRQLHAPASEIVHRRCPDALGEAVGKGRAREAGFAREPVEGPIFRRPAVDEPERGADVLVAQAGQPAAGAVGE